MLQASRVGKRCGGRMPRSDRGCQTAASARAAAQRPPTSARTAAERVETALEDRVARLEGERGLEVAHRRRGVAALEVGLRAGEVLAALRRLAALLLLAAPGLGLRLGELQARAAAGGEAAVVGGAPARVAQHRVGLGDALRDARDRVLHLGGLVAVRIGMEAARRGEV